MTTSVALVQVVAILAAASLPGHSGPLSICWHPLHCAFEKADHMGRGVQQNDRPSLWPRLAGA